MANSDLIEAINEDLSSIAAYLPADRQELVGEVRRNFKLLSEIPAITQRQLCHALNYLGLDNDLNTPDHQLAEMIFDRAVEMPSPTNENGKWVLDPNQQPSGDDRDIS